VGVVSKSERACAQAYICRRRGNENLQDLQVKFSVTLEGWHTKNLRAKMVQESKRPSGKEQVGHLYRKRKHKGDRNDNGKRVKVSKSENKSEIKANVVTNVDHLQWKKISLNNDEFEDLEEIEGVDVEYVDKDESKIVQFKVSISSEQH
jgi:hypothetical protein